MIILLCGPDSYRLEEKRSAIFGEFKNRHPQATSGFFDFTVRDELEKLKSFVANQTIFETAKLGVVRGMCAETKPARGSKNFLEEVAKNQDVTLVLCEDKDIPKPFSFLCEKEYEKFVKVQKFEFLSETQYREFILKEALVRGIELDGDALEILENAMSGNTWGLITELEKLSLLGDRKITKDKCVELLAYGAKDAILLIRRIAFETKGERLRTLEHLFARKEEAAKIFNMLAYQKKEHVLIFADYDIAVKGGKIDYEEALLDWVLARA